MGKMTRTCKNIITTVSEAMTHVVWYRPAVHFLFQTDRDHRWSRRSHKLKEFDEETFRAMIRKTAKEHSSGDVTQKFVFWIAVDDTSDFVSKRRVFKKALVETSPSKELLVVSVGLDPSVALKIGFHDGEESRGGLTKIGRFGKNHPIADGRTKKELSNFFDRRTIISRCWRDNCTGISEVVESWQAKTMECGFVGSFFVWRRRLW